MRWSLCSKKRFVLGHLCLWSVLGLAGLPALTTRPAYGQAESTGSITGRVTDASGAAIPGAMLSLKSRSDAHVVNVTTNGAGEYQFHAIPVGTYVLTVTSNGFSTYSIEDVGIDAATSVTIDAKLTAGSADSVTVEAPGTTVDPQSATIATVIDPNLVESLPLDGNNVIETAALLPGVTNVNAPSTFTSDTGGPTFNVSGARSNQNLLLLDGALWNNLYANTGLNFPPRQGLQEVSVILNNYKAQYGRNLGSVFNVLTRAGSNTLHGEAWEFVQNTLFNADDYISKANPHLVSNQFGVTLGGPIKHDKLFFQLTFQALRVGTIAFAQAPTLDAAERGLMPDGVTPRPCVTPQFAAYAQCALEDQNGTVTTSGGVTTQGTALANPVNTASTQLQAAWTVAGNTGISPCVSLLSTLSSWPQTGPNTYQYEIPSVCFNPVTKALLSTMPLPNLYPTGASPLAVSQAYAPKNDYDGLARIDWILKHHTIAARYYQTSVNDRTANGVSQGVGISTYEVDQNTAAIWAGIIDDTWTLSPSLLNTFRAAYKRYIYNIDPSDGRTITTFGSQFTQPGHDALPRYQISGRFTAGSSVNNYSRSVNEDIEADDSLNWTKGPHNFQFGLEFLRLQYLHRFDQQPSFLFNNTFTNIPAADFILGLLNSESYGNSTNSAAIQHDLYLYGQDDWRILPRVTLNVGVRYEIPFQWFQPDGQAATFIPGYQSQVFSNAPPNFAFVGDAGVERSLVGTDYKNVAPRFGIAYDVFGTGKTTVRAGFGIFYDAINALVVGVAAPYHYGANVSNPPGGISEPLLGQPVIPQNYVKGQAAQFTTPYSITFPDPNFRTPYTMAMNFGFQQVIGPSALEVNYVGRLGRHLALGYDLNPAIYDCSGYYFQLNPAVYCAGASASNSSYIQRMKYPNFNYGGTGVLDYMTVGHSSYQAGQLIYRMRARRGLTLLASYTYSRSIDNSSNGTSIANATDQPSLSVHNAPSDFNATQVLNLGWSLHFPRFHGHSALARAALNGWGFSGIYTARTGNPFSCNYGGDASLRDEGRQYCAFPASGYQPLPSNRHRSEKIAEYINTDALTGVSVPATGTYGNAPRNYFIGPAFILPTFSVQRDIRFGAKNSKLFQLRADAINAFNTPNLNQPNTGSISGVAAKNLTAGFGQIQSTIGNNGVAGTNGRRIQLSGVLRF